MWRRNTIAAGLKQFSFHVWSFFDLQHSSIGNSSGALYVKYTFATAALHVNVPERKKEQDNLIMFVLTRLLL